MPFATTTDTIAAVATAPGRGGIGVVRVSGPAVPDIARSLFGGLPPARRAALRAFYDAEGAPIDRGIVLYFCAPHSVTGEHVLELQAHGGPAVLDALLARLLAAGARPAEPGEFTQRAFINDKLDLAQAEAVADLIDAGSRQAAAAAARSLEGAFSRAVQDFTDALVALRVFVEAAIDFPEEDIDFLADGGVLARLDDLRERLRCLHAQTEQGARLREGLRIALAGAPNVGKSSLLNRLAGRDTAIVTAAPGTTRDVLREVIDLDGLPIYLADTAGLRATDDPVETEGVARAYAETAAADRVLLLVDDRVGPTAADVDFIDRLAPLPVTLIRNKCDLSGQSPGPGPDGSLRLCATDGAGIDALVAHLKTCAGLDAGQPLFSARRRHLQALDVAGAALDAGRAQLTGAAAGELLAEELRSAQTALASITGVFTSEDLLAEIFASFCIGK